MSSSKGQASDQGKSFKIRHLPSFILGTAFLVMGTSLIATAIQRDSKGNLIVLEGHLDTFSLLDVSTEGVTFRFIEYPYRFFVKKNLSEEAKEVLKKQETRGTEFRFSVEEIPFHDQSRSRLNLYYLESDHFRYASQSLESFSYNMGRLAGGNFGILLLIVGFWLFGTIWVHAQSNPESSDEIIILLACHTRKVVAVLFIIFLVYYYCTSNEGIEDKTLHYGINYIIFLSLFPLFEPRIKWIRREREIQESLKQLYRTKPETESPKEVQMVQALIQKGAVDAPNSNGQTPLHIACIAGRIEIIDLLLRNGAKINRPDAQGRTPLMLAVRTNNVPIVLKLLERCPDLTIVDHQRETALSYARKEKKETLIHLLKNASTRKSPLHSAAAAGNVARVQQLLNLGMDMDSKDTNGNTPLIHAIISDSLGVATELIERGANLLIKNKNGLTAVHLAQKFSRKEIIKVILKNQKA